jgi:hypothetical protein
MHLPQPIDEAAAKATWAADAALRREFFNDLGNYLAYLRAQARGCFRASQRGYECLESRGVRAS